MTLHSYSRPHAPVTAQGENWRLYAGDESIIEPEAVVEVSCELETHLLGKEWSEWWGRCVVMSRKVGGVQAYRIADIQSSRMVGSISSYPEIYEPLVATRGLLGSARQLDAYGGDPFFSRQFGIVTIDQECSFEANGEGISGHALIICTAGLANVMVTDNVAGVTHEFDFNPGDGLGLTYPSNTHQNQWPACAINNIGSEKLIVVVL